MSTRLILDTDIGTDVDDLFALTLILNSPELHLEGICCVYADVDVRSRMTRKILATRGLESIPVMRGARRPILGLQPVFWTGKEGQIVLAGDARTPQEHGVSDEHAADFIVRTIQANPGQIDLLAIGPLTNVALALLKAPEIAQQVKRITIMGGVLRGKGLLDKPYAEHNIRCDPEAAHVVFTSGAPITLVPLDVTEQVMLTAEHARALRAKATPFHTILADELELWFGTISAFLHEPRDFTHMHDPLAAATLIDPRVVTLTPVHLDVELSGRFSAGATLMRTPSEAHPANVEIALDVDTQRFQDLFLARIMQD